MDAEKQGQINAFATELLSGVYRRQSWRPTAINKVGNFVSSITRRMGYFANNAIRISDWSSQFFNRVQPWSDWPPLSMEFQNDNQTAGIRESLTPINAETSTGKTAPEASVIQRSTSDARISTASVPNPSLPRPAIRLAILRPEGISNRSEAKQSRMDLNHPVMSQLERPLSAPTLRFDNNASNFKPRIITSIGENEKDLEGQANAPMEVLTISVKSPRREVRGGFPILPSSLESANEQKPTMPASTLPVIRWNAVDELERADTDSEPAFYGHNAITEKMQTYQVSENPASQKLPAQPETEGLVEKLIEQTTTPTTLTGFKLKMVSPSEKNAESQTPPNEQQAGKDTSIVAPNSTKPPQLDINAVADKVYQKLVRRQQLERERRGL